MPTHEPTKQRNGLRSAPAPDAVGERLPDHKPFWERKTLGELSVEEWEQLCDGCGRCCLIKLEDEDTGDIAVTRIACKLLNVSTCLCSKYETRRQYVPDCLPLTPEAVTALHWLPDTCAYRLVSEGRKLYWWHPLLSGSRDTVHEAGISVRSFAISEGKVPEHRFSAHISSWIAARPG